MLSMGGGYVVDKITKLIDYPIKITDNRKQRIEMMVDAKFSGSACSKLYRMSMLRENNLRFENVTAEDNLFHFPLLYYSGTYVILPDTPYCVPLSPNSTTRGASIVKARRALKDIMEIQRLLEKYMSAMPEIRRDAVLMNRIRRFMAWGNMNGLFRGVLGGLEKAEISAMASEVFDLYVPKESYGMMMYLFEEYVDKL